MALAQFGVVDFAIAKKSNIPLEQREEATVYYTSVWLFRVGSI